MTKFWMGSSFTRRIFGAVALSTVPPLATTQEASSVITDARYNGRLWLKLSPTSKLWFTVALSEGHQEAISECLTEFDNNLSVMERVLSIDKRWRSTYSWEEIIKEIDLVYADPSNVIVPVAWAFRGALKRFGGASNSEMITYFDNMRRSLQQAVKSKP